MEKNRMRMSTYSFQQASIRDANIGEVFCGTVSLLFWKATAPTTWKLTNNTSNTSCFLIFKSGRNMRCGVQQGRSKPAQGSVHSKAVAWWQAPIILHQSYRHQTSHLRVLHGEIRGPSIQAETKSKRVTGLLKDVQKIAQPAKCRVQKRCLCTAMGVGTLSMTDMFIE